MINRFLAVASWSVTAILLFFAMRRWLFIFFALMPDRSKSEHYVPRSSLAPVLLLVPVRNEAHTLPALLSALDKLEYASEKLSIALIDDGSTDNSRALIQSWADERDNRHAVLLEQNLGKANALNAALEKFAQGELVAIYDADENPLPDALQHLALPFEDDRVGAVSGRRAASNALASPAASYIAFEGLVHQLVTMRAKDKLNLAPAVLGANCAYRRSALAGAGGFKPGALLEDTDLTLRLTRAGWKIRFAPQAISYHRVPRSIAGYWRQHTRWARGFNEVAKEQTTSVLFDRRLPLSLRLELIAFSMGYLDRLALLAGAILALFNKPARKPLVSAMAFGLLTPLFQIMAALKIGREPLAMWLKIAWLPLFFMLDVAMAATALWTTLRKSAPIWEERRARK